MSKVAMRLEVGPKIQAKTKYNGEIPEYAGEHMWVMVSLYQVTPNNERYDMDMENLMTIEGPGCYYCERSWTEEVAASPCRYVPAVKR